MCSSNVGRGESMFKIKEKGLALITFVIGMCVVLFVYPGLYFSRMTALSMTAIDFFQVLALVLTVWGIHYLRLRISDYIFLTFALYILREFYYPLGLGKTMVMFCFYSFLLCMTWILYHELRKRSGQIIFTFFSGILVYLVYEIVFEYAIRNAYYYWANHWHLERFGKAMLLAALTLMLVVVIGGLILLLKKVLEHYLEKLEVFCEKYKELGSYVIAIPYLFMLLFYLLEEIVFQEQFGFQENSLLIPAIIIFFLGTQVFYWKMLVSTIRLKERMNYQEEQRDRELLYHEDVQKNMQEIREMKHDLKNLFLTMGEYVARSEDAEMKDYYFTRIAPFAQNEIRMNDLYVRLEEVQNEGIRAFFYYKLLQGINEKINVEFEAKTDHSLLPYLSDETVLTRILGIFLDNAMEEVRKIPDGRITIVVKEKEGSASFLVKNTVREEVVRQGIHPGATSKGLGRGNGLLIVKKLVKKHTDMIWNSYFQEDCYVQSLTLYRQ